MEKRAHKAPVRCFYKRSCKPGLPDACPALDAGAFIIARAKLFLNKVEIPDDILLGDLFRVFMIVVSKNIAHLSGIIANRTGCPEASGLAAKNSAAFKSRPSAFGFKGTLLSS